MKTILIILLAGISFCVGAQIMEEEVKIMEKETKDGLWDPQLFDILLDLLF